MTYEQDRAYTEQEATEAMIRMRQPKQHYHDWETGGVWGIVFGVSKCKTCGVVATSQNVK